MPTVLFKFDGHSYTYNQAKNLLLSEKPDEPGIYKPVLEPKHQKRVVKYFLNAVLSEKKA